MKRSFGRPITSCHQWFLAHPTTGEDSTCALTVWIMVLISHNLLRKGVLQNGISVMKDSSHFCKEFYARVNACKGSDPTYLVVSICDN